MAKRFAETKIWDDEWYQELPVKWKLVWKYLCDRCDEAGIWKPNFRQADFQIGEKIQWSNANQYLNADKQRILITDRAWIIKEFVVFQYGEKVYTSEHGFHKKIRNMIEITKLDTLSHRVCHTLQVKEEVKEEVIKGVVGGNAENDLSWPISYLNQKLGTRYSTKTGSSTEFVKSRYSEGRTQEDFKTVIDKKVAEWLNDTKMRKYLRPETLFNKTKFDSYLNELTAPIYSPSDPRNFLKEVKR